MAYDGFLDFVRDASGGQLSRASMEQAHLRFVRDAVEIEDLRSSVVFEDPEARVRSGRLRLLNLRFMAVSTSFQSLHRYINRLLRQTEGDVAAALIGLYRPLQAALSERGGRERTAEIARRLAACRTALTPRAAAVRDTLPGACHEDFDTGVSLLQRFFGELHEYGAAEAALVAPQQWRTPQARGDTAVFLRGNDYAAEALTALRSALLVAAMCWLWIQTGWISGATAVLQAVALSAILSSSANAPAAARSLFKGFVFGAALGAICQLLALVRDDAMWIYGYFEETKLPRVHVGDRADIRLMSGAVLLHGKVEGIARGIADSDNPTSASLLADVSPTFIWIRLAQRVPVRMRIDPASVPPNTILAAGMTATVTVRQGR
ncbi:FUSC family protein [Xanthomonas cerealis]|uniref:FUSC family protein n=1 Tax=Xanthomonas cerealis TaxID=3390025 RepID=UPI00210C658C|nr:FUSC family protein [Xanthomonas translucens]